MAAGELFPLMFFISVTNECNLNCTGCCALKGPVSHFLSYELLDRIVSGAQARGTHLFGLVGGEPLLHPDLLRLVRAHPSA